MEKMKNARKNHKNGRPHPRAAVFLIVGGIDRRCHAGVQPSQQCPLWASPPHALRVIANEEKQSTLTRFASLRGTKQSIRPALRHCEERSNPGQKAVTLDCFVVPPRNDARSGSQARSDAKQKLRSNSKHL